MWKFLTSAIIALTFALPAVAQSVQSTTTVSCQNLRGMLQVLQTVSAETEVTRPTTEKWHSKSGCAYVPGRSFTASRSIAAQYGVFAPDQLGGFIGWLVTDKWLVAVEHFAFVDRTKEKAYRPAAILDRRRFTLHKRCFNLTQTIAGARIVGHQFDYRGRVYCGSPLIRSN